MKALADVMKPRAVVGGGSNTALFPFSYNFIHLVIIIYSLFLGGSLNPGIYASITLRLLKS